MVFIHKPKALEQMKTLNKPDLYQVAQVILKLEVSNDRT